MMKHFRLLFLLLVFCGKGYSQDLYWPSPEVEQMYKQAKESLARGAIKQSIVLLQQAIGLAPEVMLLHRDLAQALIVAGNYEESYNTIKSVLESSQADELTYQIAGASLLGKGEKKQAKKILEKGIKAYPHSGMLYSELGKYYETQDDLEFALDAWLKGIEGDPAYHLNYYNAARIYAETDKPIWTILYGETYVNLDRHSTRATDIKKLMLASYQKLFGKTGKTLRYGENVTAGEEQSFEAAVMQTFSQLSPVVGDGITTENLIMLKARFIMDWNINFSAKYPFSLFSYHDKMLRDGEFDAYNQWLFGKVENARQYDSWTQFHKEAISEYESWVRTNQLTPTGADFYNSKDLRALFARKRRSKS
jgi:tetratricopeptide (TPR) repeat protein